MSFYFYFIKKSTIRLRQCGWHKKGEGAENLISPFDESEKIVRLYFRTLRYYVSKNQSKSEGEEIPPP